MSKKSNVTGLIADRALPMRRVLVLLVLALIPSLVVADTSPSVILNQYAQLRNTWFAAVSGPAQQLFGLLAAVEFTWSAILLLLEKADFQSWTAGVVRQLMWIGAFYTLLLYGPTWIPAIVDSFITLGQSASGTGPLAPSDVYIRGLQIAGSLLKGSSDAGFMVNFGSALALVLAAFMAYLSFIVITVQFVVALVESYIVVSAGFIFLAFGGSRWTAPYVEKYIGLAVSVGVKIMVLHLLIGSGMALSDGWLAAAGNVPSSPSPAMSALDIVGGALIFMAICWSAPKLISGVIGGSPSLSGGDVVSTAAAAAGAAYVAGPAIYAGGKVMAQKLASFAGLNSVNSAQMAGAAQASASAGRSAGAAGGVGGGSQSASQPRPPQTNHGGATAGAPSGASAVRPPNSGASVPKPKGDK